MNEGVNSQSIIPGYAGGTINTDTDTSGGITIDSQGYEKVAFALYAGTRTDGSYLLKILETDNADGTTDAAEVPSYAVQQTLTASNTVKKVEAKLTKRYCRLRITSTGTTTGCVMKGAVAVLSTAKNNPVT
jgi:hypothetical protein